MVSGASYYQRQIVGLCGLTLGKSSLAILIPCVNVNPDTFQSRMGVLFDAYRINNEVYSVKLMGCKHELMISLFIALYTC